MADIAKLKQTRGTIKATFTNIRKFADDRTNEPADNQALNKEQIETRLEKLERAWNEFHEINDKIAILSTVSQQVENDAFEDSFFETQAMLKKLLKDRTPSIVPVFENNSTGSGHNRTFFDPDRSGIHGDIRLPRLKIQSFDGNYSEWPSFYDQYVKTVHNNESMTNVNKFHYLKTLLEGDAAKLLRHLPMTDESYTEAWDKLMNRFDRKKNIIKDYIELIMNLPNAQQSCTSLRTLCDVSDQALRGIRSLGKEWEGRDPWLLYITIKKLDPETQQLWAIHSSDKTNPTINDLLQFLSRRCDALECTSTRQQPTIKPRQPTIKSHAATNETTKFNSCPMCNKNHPLYRCFKFKGLKPLARRKFVLTNQLCGNCFRVGHFSKNCESERKCLICAEKHSTLLHINDDSTTNHTTISAQSINSSNSGTINNQQPSIRDSTYVFGTGDPINKVNVVSSSRATSVNESKVSRDSKGISDISQATCATTSYICEEFAAQALLSTVQVNIIDGSNTMQTARALLDSGSQSTLITESLAQRLKLKRFPASCVISGLSAKPAASARGCMKLQIASIYSNENLINVEALILPKLTSQIPARQINKSRWNIINNLKLADPSFANPGVIDLILGNDVFFDVLLPEKIVIEPNIVAQHTLFGWVIGGKLISSDQTGNVQSFHISTTTNHDELKVMEKFWQLEEIVVDRQIKAEDQLCENYFKATTQRDESGRFLVRLPFKESTEVLGSSYINAERRLLAIERKFTKQPQIAEQYRNFMEEYISLGHMKRIPEDKLQFNKPHFYLPHHAVCKASSTTTKLRVVFDGSCKSSSSASINEILLPGPTLQDDLTSILLRFRIHSIAISADIEKMYRQVKVQDADCDFQRISWRDHPSKRFEHYRLKTVTYGISSAPFLAIRTMLELATIYEAIYPKASSILRRDFYVDDMLTGCEDYETATIIYRQISHLLAEGGFKIRKWISNDQNLLQTIPVVDRGTDESFSLDDDPTYYKTLGLHWNPLRDCFSFKVSLHEHIKLSKRSLLSEASRVFDPLGLLAPITVKFKMLFQEVWKRKIDWDQELPCDIAEHWTEIKSSLKLLETLQISRCLKIVQPVSMELHIFCDASQKAYGSAAYLRSTDSSGISEVRLIAAKSRVAPLETTSLPRLELCAAVLGTKLYKYLQPALNLSYNNVYAWTDSQIVLAWLADHPSRWKNFVANRTAYIRKLLPEVHWNHIESKLNPADHTSRGLTPRQLLSNTLWWSGPEYLQLEKSCWPMSSRDLHSDTPEQRKTKLISNHASLVCASSAVKVTSNMCEQLFNYYSSVQKIYRIISFVCRFYINKLLFRRNHRNDQILKSNAVDVSSILPPNVLEIAIAENICVRWVQYNAFKAEVLSLREKNSVSKVSKLIMLHPFIDKNQIMRVGGRLSMSDCEFDAKHPIILPKDHIYTKYLIKYLHEFHLHVGATSLTKIIRQKYWIVGFRNMVRRHILRCVKCFKLRKHQNAQIMGNLPEYRVTCGRVFMHTGVDYAGPIWIRDRSGRGPYKPVKGYIALFVCIRVKAIHIEVVSSLTTEAFVMALQRFIARRGKPVEILSDNGTNFVGARKELDKLFDLFKSEEHFPLVSNFLTSLKINFRFIPARSPHFGGLWEANIKSYKYLLQRSTGTAPLTFEQLYTVSSQIEAILNSRPICAMSESPDNYDALTPGHFLIGSPLVSLPEPFVEGIQISRLSMYQNIQQRVEIFWKRWSKDYLSSLQQRSKWKVAQPNLKPNQLVLIKEDNLPKGTWLIGKIVNVYPGNDGKVRVATVKTPKGEITRSIVKLVPLPIDEHQTATYKVIHGVHIEPAHIIKKRSISSPLRILLFYDDSVYRLDADKFELINNTILPEAVQFWEEALMVRETKEVIRLNRKCESTQVFVKNSLTHCIDSCKVETMCGEVTVPEKHLDVCRTCNATGQDCKVDRNSTAGPGIENADFVFYVSARQTERCHKGLTVAYAAHCQQEAALDRPIAGHANLCPDSISTKPQELQTLLSTVKHEILHALGFSVSLYAFFRDENGNPRTTRKPDTGKPYLNEKLQIHQWSNATIRKVYRDRWAVKNGHITRTIDMMVTPKVVEEVRKHFNCMHLEGAELEDQGGEGTALTHWEKRILENEAMTGTHTQSPVFSRITLALMEDSGWYKPNYSMAQPLSWGKNLGCNFVMKSCKDWITMSTANLTEDDSETTRGRSIHPFCSKVKRDPLQTECTTDRNSVALCNLIRHPTPLSKEYQNFDHIAHVPKGQEEYYGGSVSLADHCPYIQEFTWRSKNIVVRGSQCQFEENNPKPEKNFALETYGEGSKCFEHTEKMWEERSCRQTREWQHWGSGCYQYKCENGRLSILVGNYTYICYFPGQEIFIRIMGGGWLHKGAIVCPSCHELCAEYFETTNEYCKLSEEAPPPNYYPRDDLKCSATSQYNFNLIYFSILLITILGLR